VFTDTGSSQIGFPLNPNGTAGGKPQAPGYGNIPTNLAHALLVVAAGFLAVVLEATLIPKEANE